MGQSRAKPGDCFRPSSSCDIPLPSSIPLGCLHTQAGSSRSPRPLLSLQKLRLTKEMELDVLRSERKEPNVALGQGEKKVRV